VPVAAAFGCVLALHFVVHAFILPDEVASPEFDAKVEKIDAKSLDKGIEGFRLVGFGTEKRDMGSAFGERSKIWIYAKGTRLDISLDYPFPKFHDVGPCYIGKGWTVEGSNSTREPEDAKAPAVWHELRLRKAGGRFGYVVFAEFNAEGDPLEGESRLLGAVNRHEKALQALYDRFFNPSKFNAPRPMGPAYQIQAMIEADEPIQDKDKAELQQVFFAAVRQLRGQLFDPKPK
jgi:hypothetical protein